MVAPADVVALARRQPLLVYGGVAAGVAAFAIYRNASQGAGDASAVEVPSPANEGLSQTDYAGIVAGALEQLGVDDLFGGAGAPSSAPSPSPSPSPTPTPTPTPSACGVRPAFVQPFGTQWVCTPGVGWRLIPIDGAIPGPTPVPSPTPLPPAPASSFTISPVVIGTRRTTATLGTREATTLVPDVRTMASARSPLPGGLQAGGRGRARRVAFVDRPTRVWFPDGHSRIARNGDVLPIAKGELAGDITHLVVDGPFAGGHLIRHGAGYRVATLAGARA